MTRDKLLAAAALAVSLGVLVSLSDADVGERPVDGRIHHKGESKLLELPDGGKGYSYPTTFDCDGGTEWVREDGGSTPIDIGDAGTQVWKIATCTEYLVTDVAPCVRAPADGGECLRLLDDGGAAFFGALNRFPREQAVGASCEPVACSVVAGEDPNEDEGARIRRQRGRRDAGD